MKIVLAPDSFKESLGAASVARALAEGWREADAVSELVLAPMADGGEGTVEAVVTAADGEYVRLSVTGPLGTPVQAEYGLIGGGATAVFEMAQASGLPLVPPEQRDPRITTTRGTGELLAHALEQGARRIILGIGGSATNDGGAGMAQALGARLLDAAGRELPPGGAALARLHQIDLSNLHPALSKCRIDVACDVTNPLIGPQGASAVFGPQKGATPQIVAKLDAALAHFGRVLEEMSGRNVVETPGSGAAGGLGAGLMALCGARLTPGVPLIAELTGLREKLMRASLVVTGEGRVDSQTLSGKVPAGVAALAREHGVPVVIVAGSLGDGWEQLYDQAVLAIFPVTPGPATLGEAFARAEANLRAAGRAIGGLCTRWVRDGAAQ